MGTVIYSASPFQALLGSLGAILLLFALGLVGIGLALFRSNQGSGTRVIIGICGGFLLIASLIYAAITLTAASGGTQSVSVSLDNKSIVEDNCGDNGQTCSRYVLEATTSTTAYEFDVAPEVYNKAQVGTCYRFTYFPNKGLFAGDKAAYQQI